MGREAVCGVFQVRNQADDAELMTPVTLRILRELCCDSHHPLQKVRPVIRNLCTMDLD